MIRTYDNGLAAHVQPALKSTAAWNSRFYVSNAGVFSDPIAFIDPQIIVWPVARDPLLTMKITLSTAWLLLSSISIASATSFSRGLAGISSRGALFGVRGGGLFGGKGDAAEK